jgi:hypothetical protein
VISKEYAQGIQNVLGIENEGSELFASRKRDRRIGNFRAGAIGDWLKTEVRFLA